MLKLAIGLFAGMLLTGSLFMGPLSSTPAIGQSDNSSDGGIISDIIKTYQENIASIPQEAGTEIQDDDIAQFYHKLLEELDLDGAASEITDDEAADLAKILPDIKNINRSALTLPLQEAGKNIKDEEIADFYYQFLEKAGLTDESN